MGENHSNVSNPSQNEAAYLMLFKAYTMQGPTMEEDNSTQLPG